MELLNANQLSVLSVNVQQALQRNKRWRAGQAMFNCLAEMNIELANSVRGTVNDCFYNNSRIKDFFKAICNEEALKSLNPRWK